MSVTALAANGTLDTFNAVSSNSEVATVTRNGTLATITALGAGTANIVFRSGSDASLTRTIAATIALQFIQPTQTYLLGGVTYPAAMASDEYVDAPLKLAFGSPPVLGTGGTFRVFRKADDLLVDVVRLAGETDMLGYIDQDQVRKVNTTPIKISGNTATIKLHSNRLDDNTEYDAWRWPMACLPTPR